MLVSGPAEGRGPGLDRGPSSSRPGDIRTRARPDWPARAGAVLNPDADRSRRIPREPRLIRWDRLEACHEEAQRS